MAQGYRLSLSVGEQIVGKAFTRLSDKSKIKNFE